MSIKNRPPERKPNHSSHLKCIQYYSICGPFAVAMSNISEFHGVKYRTRIMMVIGMINSVANVILPILACLILPHHILFEWPHFRSKLRLHFKRSDT